MPPPEDWYARAIAVSAALFLARLKPRYRERVHQLRFNGFSTFLMMGFERIGVGSLDPPGKPLKRLETMRVTVARPEGRSNKTSRLTLTTGSTESRPTNPRSR